MTARLTDNRVSDDNLNLLLGEATHGKNKDGWIKVDAGMVRRMTIELKELRAKYESLRFIAGEPHHCKGCANIECCPGSMLP